MRTADVKTRAEVVEPIRRSLTVRCARDAAFRLLTEGMGSWWPIGSHSIWEQDGETVVFEPGLGGRIYERKRDGTVGMWGEVIVWEPPARFVCLWRPGGWPQSPTELEVRFEAVADGTHVSLEHRGWERLGDRALAARAEYDSDTGWALVFDHRFREAADRE